MSLHKYVGLKKSDSYPGIPVFLSDNGSYFRRAVKILHTDSDTLYHLFKEEGNFIVQHGHLRTAQAGKDLHAAIWYLIDWVRMSRFTNITDHELAFIHKILNTKLSLDKESVMTLICGKKIDVLFYEKAFSLILEKFLVNEKEVTLANEHNFFICHEIVQIIRQNSFAIYS